MKKSQLEHIVATAKRQFAAGEISQSQYDIFMDRVRDFRLHNLIEDPVWEKPLRPISKPRPHIRGAYKKYAE